MPLPYQNQFRQLGGDVGAAAGGATGAAGGGLLGALGQLLEPLDYPRQALWNLGGGIAHGLSEGDWSHALKAVPGALGVAAGAAATPFLGLHGGIGVGSAVGGLAQGVAKHFGGDRFDAPEVKDLTGTDDMIPNMLVGALTDPLTYAGGLGGASKGKAIGQKVGSEFGAGLNDLAMARGPRYGTDPGKIGDILGQSGMRTELVDKGHLASHFGNILKHPEALNELAPGSKYLGSGVEGVAFHNPDNNTVSLFRRANSDVFGVGSNGLGRNEIQYNAGHVPARPALPEFIQPARSKHFGAPEGGEALRVEHLPLARTIGEDEAGALGRQLRSGVKPDELVQQEALQRSMQLQGFHPGDMHLGNVAWLDRIHGNPEMKILDPGAVYAKKNPIPLGPEVSPVADTFGNRMKGKLLDYLGADQQVRMELGHQLNDPRAYEALVQRNLAAEPSGHLVAGQGGVNHVYSPADMAAQQKTDAMMEALRGKMEANKAAPPGVRERAQAMQALPSSPVNFDGGTANLGPAARPQQPIEAVMDSWLKPQSVPAGGLDEAGQAQHRLAVLDAALSNAKAQPGLLPMDEMLKVLSGRDRAIESLIGHVGSDQANHLLEMIRQQRHQARAF